MTRSNEPSDELLEQAALYALGALGPEEARRFEALLAERPALAEEVRSLAATAGLLGLAPPAASPPRRVLARVLGRIRRPAAEAAAPAGAAIQPWQSWPASDPAAGMEIVRGDEPFVDVGLPGVRTRRLHVDAATGRITMLVRMDPGASYPAHQHGGLEECYVLEGTLRIGDETRMAAGDYQVAPEGSIHPVQWTETGCTLFLVSSPSDRILAR